MILHRRLSELADWYNTRPDDLRELLLALGCPVQQDFVTSTGLEAVKLVHDLSSKLQDLPEEEGDDDETHSS